MPQWDQMESLATGSFEQTQGDIAQWINDWKKKYAGAQLIIAIETTRGALINALMEYPEVVIYPVNPAAMAYFRKAFKHGGGKSDDTDAALILKYLRNQPRGIAAVGQQLS